MVLRQELEAALNLIEHPCPVVRERAQCIVVDIAAGRLTLQNGQDELDWLENNINLHERAIQATFRRE